MRSLLTTFRRISGGLGAALLLGLAAAPVAAASAGSGSITTPTVTASTFTDISGNYAEYDIVTLAQAGIIEVPKDRLFQPNAPITRLDFADWISRALELPPSSKALPSLFSDAALVPQADQGLVASAVQAGLIQGMPGRVFDPSGDLTRAQAATIFGRYLETKGETPDTRYFTLFADGSTVPDWAKPAAVLVHDYLLEGEPCGAPTLCFAPQQDTTRAQAATLIMRLLQYLTVNYHVAPLKTPTTTAPFLMGMWYSDTQEAYQNLTTYGASSINWLVIGGYDILPNGTLSGFDSSPALQWAAAHPSVSTWVMVQALGAPYTNFLASPAQQQAIIQSVVQVVQRAGYAGVNFDIEAVPASEATAYLAFLTQAAAALHAIGAKISVAVPPETASTAGYSWVQAFDYPALGQIVDYVCMMTYSYHYQGSVPGPVAPVTDLQEAINYAASVMTPSKVILGLPVYGYIWNTSNDSAGAYWESGMENEANLYGATITYNPFYQEATFTYTQNGTSYVGWFVNAAGVAYRLTMARDAGIGGVIAWRMDYGATDWWPIWQQDLAAWN